jgi:U3 small nucleolar ribonucleoprotein protein IMP4
MAFVNEGDFISFRLVYSFRFSLMQIANIEIIFDDRHHVYVKTSHKEVQLAEVGPRFEMRPYEIRQGTIEQTEADVEWALRPYQRTARKRNQL